MKAVDKEIIFFNDLWYGPNGKANNISAMESILQLSTLATLIDFWGIQKNLNINCILWHQTTVGWLDDWKIKHTNTQTDT